MTAPIVFQNSRLPWPSTMYAPISGDKHVELHEDGQLWERIAESALSGPVRPTEPRTPVPASVHSSESRNAAHSLKSVLMSEPERSTT